jgi:hypothetical protein
VTLHAYVAFIGSGRSSHARRARENLPRLVLGDHPPRRLTLIDPPSDEDVDLDGFEAVDAAHIRSTLIVTRPGSRRALD